MRTLGLDVGSKTIGLALGDASGTIATALRVLARRGHQDDARAVAECVAEHDVGCVVVGLPLELDGRVGRRAQRVQQFVDVLTQTLEVPIESWDERFSTAAAERTLIEADVSRRKRKTKIDALAAQFILQGWLDARPGQPEANADGADGDI